MSLSKTTSRNRKDEVNKMLDLTKFTTEQRNQKSMDLDTMTSLQIVTTMNDEDLRAVQSVTKVLPQVATAIDWLPSARARRARLLYGRGHERSFGRARRVGVPPTFGVSPDLIVGSLPEARRRLSRLSRAPKTARSLARATCGSVDSRIRILSLAWRQAVVLPMCGWPCVRQSNRCKTIAIACNQGRRSGRAQILPLSPCPVPRC